MKHDPPLVADWYPCATSNPQLLLATGLLVAKGLVGNTFGRGGDGDGGGGLGDGSGGLGDGGGGDGDGGDGDGGGGLLSGGEVVERPKSSHASRVRVIVGVGGVDGAHPPKPWSGAALL
eukprot:scaffold12232_cov71-Phaeocystis_antarctica.AAC.1